MSYPSGFRLAQAIGIVGAAWLSGNIAALSMNAAPALQASRRESNAPPDLIVKQWRSIFETGKTQNPPIAVVSASAFLYLAYSVRKGSPLFRPATYSPAGLYCTAAVLTLGIIPYTLVTMTKTNTALLNLAESKAPLSDQTTAESNKLIDRWIFLNGIRSLLPLAGSFVGIAAWLI